MKYLFDPRPTLLFHFYRKWVTCFLLAVVTCFIVWLSRNITELQNERVLIVKIEALGGKVYFTEHVPSFFQRFTANAGIDIFKRVNAVSLPTRNERTPEYTREAMLVIRDFEYIKELHFVGSFFDDIYCGPCCLDVNSIQRRFPDLQIAGSLH